MSKGYSNISIKTKKFTSTSQNSLVNLGKHLLRQDDQKNKLIDHNKTSQNEVLISMTGENLSKSLKNFLTENDLKVVRKDQIQAYQVVFSCDKETFKDPELLASWKQETLKMIQEHPTFKDNCLMAVYHGDEVQPHIQAVFVPRVGKKLAYNELLGGQKGGLKLGKLHDDYAKYHEPLGFKRGDGNHTTGLSYKDYKKAVIELTKPVKEITPIPEPKKFLGITINQKEIIEAQAKQLKVLKPATKKLYFFQNQNNQIKKNQKKLKEKAKESIENEKKVKELEQSQKQSAEKDKRFKEIFNENIKLKEVNEQSAADIKKYNENLANIKRLSDLKQWEERQKQNPNLIDKNPKPK